MTEKKSCLGFVFPAEGSSPPIILSSTDSSMGGSEIAGGTLSAAFAADVMELELSDMFSVLCRLIDHNRRGLSFDVDLQGEVTYLVSCLYY